MKFGASIRRGQHLCKPDFSTVPALTRDLVGLFLGDLGERSSDAYTSNK